MGTLIVVRYGKELVPQNGVQRNSKETQEPDEQQPTWEIAVKAAESKKAIDIRVLDLRGVSSFADFFVICSGTNQRQIQAIADEVHLQMKKAGELPISLEGYDNAEWVLADYGDVLVHIFSEKARSYYELERLWRHAKQVPVPA